MIDDFKDLLHVADAFYYIEHNRIMVDVVQHIRYDVYIDQSADIIFDGVYFSFGNEDIGNTVFISFEEAEAALHQDVMSEATASTKNDDTCGTPSEEEFNQIRKYDLRSKYLPKDIYVFKIKLCDNNVDSQFERFPVCTLEQLAELYLGVRGYIDDELVCKIFDCKLNPVLGETTQLGDDLFELVAKAYIVRNEHTQRIISKIQQGKISSVDCNFSICDRICSICNDSTYTCSHKSGEIYDGELCCDELINVVDVYDFSFITT